MALDNFGALILAHQRPRLLRPICDQLRQHFPGVVVHITLDRPTDEVYQAAEASGAVVHRLPFAVLDDDGEHYMAARNWQLERLVEDRVCRYVALWDDDHLLEDPTEARGILGEGKFDLIYATKAFFWNDLDHTNERMPAHTSPLFFRYLPGDRYPDNERKIIHAPEWIHDNRGSKSTTLRGRLLDVGYLDSGERQRVATEYFRAGKIDRVTLALVDEPDLRPFVSDSHEYLRLREIFEPFAQ